MNPGQNRVDPEIARLQVEAYRKMSPSEKMKIAQDLINFVAETQMIAIRRAHPEADEHELRLRLASRWVRNPELLKAAFGWDVAEKGY